MQQEPAPTRSPGPQQDSTLPDASAMPPPESPSEGHQPSQSHGPAEQIMEEEFQFLRCQGCQAEAKCPKLLPCLHTLCSGCLEEPGKQCPICQAPWPPGTDAQTLDNVFFESLQRRLSVYRQIVGVQALCTRCKESADYWCFECEQLLCAKCIEAHQWFLKHEARPLVELRSQSVQEFLDSTRKSNNIFCSNPNHRSPALTSIYCRGCSKPLCCSCALLDRGHSELKCDISTEIQQRQEELDAMTRDLQEQDRTFSVAQAQMRSAVSQLGRMRADTEELIHSHVRDVVAHVLAQERELLERVNARYQQDHEEIAGQLGRLDAVLQRIRMGSALVQRMKLYASDQEVLDMHGFLRKALHQLRQEEPRSLQATVRTDSFDEFKVRLQDLVSCITKDTDAAVSRRASPEAAGTPRDNFDNDLPEEVQRAQVQAPGMAVVQPVPGAHPVPVYAYSIKDPSCREEVSNTATPQKRKSCQTECPRKIIKMESEEEKELRGARRGDQQLRRVRSRKLGAKGIGIEWKVGLGGPRSLPALSLRFCVGKRVEPTETVAPPSSPAHPTPRARRASYPCRASRLPRGTCRPLACPPHHPDAQAAIPDAKCPSQSAGHQEQAAVHRGISFVSRRAPGTPRIRHILRLPLKLYCGPLWTCPPSTAQATTPAATTIGPPSQPAGPQDPPARLQRASGQPRWVGQAARARSHSLRGSPRVAQWLNNFFALPLSPVAPQLGASVLGGLRGGRAPQTLGAGVSSGDSGRAPVENPQVQVPQEVPRDAFPPPRPPEKAPTSTSAPQTSL
ncbi:protein PML isoform X3 [Hippopotamus amphibius kiboko]|uniref:protein PML isoform X3 n=1 Tax=Hippopotamus amphibius kiboko TaxID=575201 RepID=UPI00259727C0|nr:protein PML isoform X3 [Hippopotamus amphibius kiboko]